MSNFYRDRARAEGFGAQAARYDQVRPSYPAELVQWLSQEGPGAAVDVGCGTGRVAQLLTEAGWSVVGVEPDERMAEVARSRSIQVVVSRLEQWAASKGAYDLVCSGTAWHWVDPKVGYDCAARLLRPGGRLAVFRNSYRYPPDVAHVIDAALRRNAPSLWGHCIPVGHSTGSLIEQHRTELAEHPDLFTDIEIRTFAHERTVTVEDWIDELQTHSPISMLDRPVRTELLNELAHGFIGQPARYLRIQHESHCVAARRR